MKRALDVVASAVGLLLLLPLLALVSALVWFCSGRPILFRQERVGRFGGTFRIVKFRSMTVRPSTSEVAFEPGNSSRITPVGLWLRRTKIDELPQLWNVLKGDMSLVGPRPEVRLWVDAYPERWAHVLTVRPGITDPASVVYRDEEDVLARSADPHRCYREEVLPHKLDLYERYLATHSFWKDVRILLETTCVVFRLKRPDRQRHPR
jgi:lipopolysaccharide/colanic/teichoic acid biosynthesis glycosyltransferase